MDLMDIGILALVFAFVLAVAMVDVAAQHKEENRRPILKRIRAIRRRN